MAFCVVKPFPALSMPRDTNSAILRVEFEVFVQHTASPAME